jgi:hypothetical protein
MFGRTGWSRAHDSEPEILHQLELPSESGRAFYDEGPLGHVLIYNVGTDRDLRTLRLILLTMDHK